jgi:hypothetical protein
MGVLDDAIREHLDLKRRHGVAEEELRRQEEEALGPARREVAPAEADEDGNGASAEVEHAAEADAEAAPAAEAAPEPELHERDELEEPALSGALPEEGLRSDVREDQAVLDEPTEDHVPARESAVDEAPPRAGDTPARGFEELDDDELLDEDESPLEEEPLPHEELADDDEDAEGDEAAEAEDADLLEDTPDFLQETPEHDRLWFEQKPPRDFDFD